MTPFLPPPLTTVVDVHVVQSYVGGPVPAVELLRVEPGLSSLLPQLDPADVAAAVEHHSVQVPGLRNNNNNNNISLIIRDRTQCYSLFICQCHKHSWGININVKLI